MELQLENPHLDLIESSLGYKSLAKTISEKLLSFL